MSRGFVSGGGVFRRVPRYYVGWDEMRRGKLRMTVKRGRRDEEGQIKGMN